MVSLPGRAGPGRGTPALRRRGRGEDRGAAENFPSSRQTFCGRSRRLPAGGATGGSSVLGAQVGPHLAGRAGPPGPRAPPSAPGARRPGRLFLPLVCDSRCPATAAQPHPLPPRNLSRSPRAPGRCRFPSEAQSADSVFGRSAVRPRREGREEVLRGFLVSTPYSCPGGPRRPLWVAGV